MYKRIPSIFCISNPIGYIIIFLLPRSADALLTDLKYPD